MPSPADARSFDDSSEKARVASTVVFLGPTLPIAAAREILDAHYAPPARFGDIYRLMGTRVDTIVLIDGFFHGHAPVWPRELLCALENGIAVYGASSMGALRAAELHLYGMVGIGTIFQWYVTGEIDGDDEVALLHASAEHDYRALSEPLVNLRANLELAVRQGIVDQNQADSLVASLKVLPFHARNRNALWTAAAEVLPNDEACARLRHFFAAHAIDRKRLDAIETLTQVARRQDHSPMVAPLGSSRHSYHDHHRLLERSFFGTLDAPISGRMLRDRLLLDQKLQRQLRWAMTAKFFVLQWARERGVQWPAGKSTSSEGQSFREHPRAFANQHEAQANHELWSWILAQPPERFGLLSVLQNESLQHEFPPRGIWEPLLHRYGWARALPFISAWCQHVGAAPKATEAAALKARWERPLRTLQEHHAAFLEAVWALEKGPAYFGFTSWSFEAALLEELQITGLGSRLIQEWFEVP